MTTALTAMKPTQGNFGALQTMLSKKQAQIGNLRSLAKQSMSPIEATLATQAGAAAAGAAAAFLTPKNAAMACVVVGFGALAAGAVYEEPRLVAAGNGALAGFVAMQTAEFLRPGSVADLRRAFVSEPEAAQVAA